MTASTTYAERLSLVRLVPIARILVATGILSVMLYVPFLNKSFWAAVILLFASGVWRQTWSHMQKEPVFIASFLLILLFAIGIFYSHGSWHHSLRSLNKYSKVCYLFFFIPLFNDKNKQNLAMFALIASVMIGELLTYLHYFNVFSFGQPPSKHWLCVQDLDACLIVGFTTYLLANFAIDQKKYRILYLCGVIICTIDLLFLNQERTGYLIYMGLTALLLWQRLGWKGFLCAFLAIPILFSGLYGFSSKFKTRTNQVVTEITQYQKGKVRTSIGLRLSFAKYSLGEIKQHPWVGLGTGSFQELYRINNGPKLVDGTWPSHNHNEYLSFLFHWGIMGLTLFCYWLYRLLQVSSRLQKRDKNLFRGLLLSFILLGFCNASLYVNPAGSFFITFTAVFLSPYYYQKWNQIKPCV